MSASSFLVASIFVMSLAQISAQSTILTTEVTEAATTEITEAATTQSDASTATEPDVTTVTEVIVSSTAVSDGVTETTYEATSYIDEQAIYCREYLRNNTNWEPYPTYADNGASIQTVLTTITSVGAIMLLALFV